MKNLQMNSGCLRFAFSHILLNNNEKLCREVELDNRVWAPKNHGTVKVCIQQPAISIHVTAVLLGICAHGKSGTPGIGTNDGLS